MDLFLFPYWPVFSFQVLRFTSKLWVVKMKLPFVNSQVFYYRNSLYLLLSVQELFSKVVFFILHLSWSSPISGFFLFPGFWSPGHLLTRECPNLRSSSEIITTIFFPGDALGHIIIFPPFSVSASPSSPLKQFLFLSFLNPLWLRVEETTANCCRIQHFPSLPLEWIAFCSLEKQGF